MSVIYIYSNNGLSYRLEQDTYTVQSGEIIFFDFATPAQLTAAFPGYAAAIAAAAQPPAPVMDIPTLVKLLITKNLITQVDVNAALAAKPAVPYV